MCAHVHSSHLQVSFVAPLGMNHLLQEEASSELVKAGSGRQHREWQAVSLLLFQGGNISSHFGAAPPTRGSQANA